MNESLEQRIRRRASRSSNRHDIAALLRLADELKGKPMSKLDDACRALVTAQSGADDWDALDDELKDQIRGEIRAVFQAVRGPSAKMLVEGYASRGIDRQPVDVASDPLALRWKAMIDALLSE